MGELVLGGIIAFLVSLLATPGAARLAVCLGAVDRPEKRKVHRKVMPRLGGLAVYLGFTLVLVLTQRWDLTLLGLVLGGTVVFVTGFLDDLRGLSPKLKLAGQVAGALILVVCGVRLDFLTNPFDGMIFLGNLAIPATILWVVIVTNAVNLIDGLDGLAAGTAAIAGLTIFIIAWSEGQVQAAAGAIILTGASLGFLRHNFFPARIFMGDSGSLFLGFNLAALAAIGFTKGPTFISLFVPVIILGIPIMDTVLAVGRRWLEHRPVMQPDMGHLHHRLLALGLPHRRVVVVIYVVNMALGGSAILMSRLTTEQSLPLLAGLALFASWAAGRMGLNWRRVLFRLKRASKISSSVKG